MKIGFFSSKTYEKPFFEEANRKHGHDLFFVEASLDESSCILATGCDAVSVFVNDRVTSEIISTLAEQGVQIIALRCAGFNNVDVEHAKQLNIPVVRVPQYSPYAVAEHTLALILSLNRKIHRAFNRVREGNFSLDGLLGFDLHQKTVGLVGTGSIGKVCADILLGFGCKVLAFDPNQDKDLLERGVGYCQMEDLLARADIISLHCPLTDQTRHMIDEKAIKKMKKGVMLINTSRGALIDTPAVIQALKNRQIGSLGMDVYEEEETLFFSDRSQEVIDDDTFARLLTFPNVLVTGHQAFFTQEAMDNIANTTLENITNFESGLMIPNQVS